MKHLLRALEDYHPETAEHSKRVADLATRIGQLEGLSSEATATLYEAGLYHDVGKTAVPLEILDKTDELTQDDKKWRGCSSSCF